MSSGTTTTTTKVRLVRCPKCRLVLPEMPNIPVYQCGGCFTTLQAKSQRQTITSLPETPVEEANNLDNVGEDKASSSSSHETTLQCAKECHSESDQNIGMGQTQCEDINNIDDLKGENIVSENSDQNGEKLEYNHSNDILKSGSNSDEAGESEDEQVICANSSNEDHNSDSHQHDSSTCNENCLSEEPEFHVKVEDNSESSSFVAEIKTEAETDVKGETDYTYKRSNKGENCSIITTGETLSSGLNHRLDRLRSTDTYYSSLNEQLEQHQETALHGPDRLWSADTFHTSPNEQLQERTLRGLDRLFSTDTVYVSSNEQLEQPPEVSRYGFDPSSEFTTSLIDLSKSPTTRSSRAYYDDGVSSHDGIDHQLHNRHKHGSRHAHRVASHAHRVPLNGNYRSQQHFKNSAEILAGGSHYPSKYSMLDRNGTNLETDEYLNHNSFYERQSLATANRIPTELYYTSNFTSPDRGAYADEEKAKLLRMVSVLQDQLNKASFNDKATGRDNWKDHRIPMYYGPEESFYNSPDPAYSRSNWSRQRKYSHIPFSAEAAINRQWSAQFPPHLNLFNSYGSCPSSPQRNMDPRFHSYSRRARSDDQMHRDNGIRKYFREKPQLPRRHLRPLAGGAPFVTCLNCLKQLQLPADFLLFKKKCHLLKCGACSEVLRFSLANHTNLIPYEHSDAIHGRRNFTSTSHVTGCPSVSCSDDCGMSGKAVDREMSNGLAEHEKERKMSYLNESRSKGKAPVEYETVGPSTSKIVSSEIEELSDEAERGRSSPLHRLMGYSSARQVLYS